MHYNSKYVGKSKNYVAWRIRARNVTVQSTRLSCGEQFIASRSAWEAAETAPLVFKVVSERSWCQPTNLWAACLPFSFHFRCRLLSSFFLCLSRQPWWTLVTKRISIRCQSFERESPVLGGKVCIDQTDPLSYYLSNAAA